jgi:hypothetical protein
VETTNGKNSVISKLMTFVENAETGEFLFLITVITLIASLVHDVIHAKIVIHIIDTMYLTTYQFFSFIV